MIPVRVLTSSWVLRWDGSVGVCGQRIHDVHPGSCLGRNWPLKARFTNIWIQQSSINHISTGLLHIGYVSYPVLAFFTHTGVVHIWTKKNVKLKAAQRAHLLCTLCVFLICLHNSTIHNHLIEIILYTFHKKKTNYVVLNYYYFLYHLLYNFLLIYYYY